MKNLSRLWAPTADALNYDEVKRGLRMLIVTGLLSQIMVTFTSGTFLVALAIQLGASNFVVGLLAAVAPLAQLLQLPSVYLVEKVRNRRFLSVVSTIASRLTWFGIAAIPIFFANERGLWMLVGLVFLQSALAALAGACWNSWVRDLVPQEQMGTFFARRMLVAGVVGTILSPLAGYFVDWWSASAGGGVLISFSVLFVAGALAGIIGAYFLARVPEPPMEAADEPFSFIQSLGHPFKDQNFRRLMIYQFIWNFAVNLAAPFFTVYMLNSLGMSMSMVVILATLSQLFNLFFLPIWGRVSDRFSYKAVLRIGTPAFLLTLVAWTFATLPDRHILTIPLLILIHIISGISMSGISLASGNIGYKLAPRGEAAAYLGVAGVMNSIAAGVAPIIGGQGADFFTKRELSLTVSYMSPGHNLAFRAFGLEGWDFFFFLAFVIGLLALHRLALVREAGETDEDVVVREVLTQARHEVQHLSTIGGLRQLLQFPVVRLNNLRNYLNFWQSTRVRRHSHK